MLMRLSALTSAGLRCPISKKRCSSIDKMMRNLPASKIGCNTFDRSTAPVPSSKNSCASSRQMMIFFASYASLSTCMTRFSSSPRPGAAAINVAESRMNTWRNRKFSGTCASASSKRSANARITVVLPEPDCPTSTAFCRPLLPNVSTS